MWSHRFVFVMEFFYRQYVSVPVLTANYVTLELCLCDVTHLSTKVQQHKTSLNECRFITQGTKRKQNEEFK